MSRTTTVALVAAAVLAPLTMSGCLVSSARADKIDGAYVQPGAIARVKLHETSAEEVEELLGQPSSRIDNPDDGSSLWTWNWTQTKGDSGTVLFIFSGSSAKRVSESVHVRIRDGVAVEKWRD